MEHARILNKRLTNLSPSILYCLYERAFWFLPPDLVCGAETPICLTHSSLLFPSVFPSDAWGHRNFHPSIDSILLSLFKFQDNNPIILISEYQLYQLIILKVSSVFPRLRMCSFRHRIVSSSLLRKGSKHNSLLQCQHCKFHLVASQ